MQAYALPLPADHVVGQVVEHAVGPVAAQHHLRPGRALGHERAVDVEPGVGVEVERRAGGKAQGDEAVNLNSAVHHYGAGRAAERGVAAYDHVAQQRGVPRVGVEVDTLAGAALEGELKVVLEQPGAFLAVDGRRQLYEHAQAVLVAQLYVVHLIARRGTEILAVDVDTEARLVAVDEAHVGAAYAVARAVVYPEGARGRRHR